MPTISEWTREQQRQEQETAILKIRRLFGCTLCDPDFRGPRHVPEEHTAAVEQAAAELALERAAAEEAEEERRREAAELREADALYFEELTQEERDAIEAEIVQDLRASAAARVTESGQIRWGSTPEDEERKWRLGALRMIREKARAPAADAQDWSAPTRDLRARSKLRRFKTGIGVLDDATGGGPPEGAFMTVEGREECGKTTLAVNVAVAAALQGRAVAILFADSGREAGLGRIADRIGLDGKAVEAGDPKVCAILDRWLRKRRIFVPPDEASVESVIERMRPLVRERMVALIVDSVHEAYFRTSENVEGERLQAEAGIDVLKRASIELPCFALGTAELNRMGSGGALTRKFGFAPRLILRLEVSKRSKDQEGNEKPELVRASLYKNKLTGKHPVFHLELKDHATYAQAGGPAAARELDKRERAARDARKKMLDGLRPVWNRAAMIRRAPRAISRKHLGRLAGLNVSRPAFADGLQMLIDEKVLRPVQRGSLVYYMPGPLWPVFPVEEPEPAEEPEPEGGQE